MYRPKATAAAYFHWDLCEGKIVMGNTILDAGGLTERKPVEYSLTTNHTYDTAENPTQSTVMSGK